MLIDNIEVDLFDCARDDTIDHLIELSVALRHEKDILFLTLNFALICLLEPNSITLWLCLVLVLLKLICIAIFVLLKQGV